ncbi:MAG: hypothetical protein K5906_05165 [Bacilli bacterium]|nr:hypothetical protein [Bacilli bacterium]
MKPYNMLILTLPLLLAGCSSNNSSSSIEASNEVSEESEEDSIISESVVTNPLTKNYYQLLVYAFSDSNNDGIGDFKGIVNKLDYLSNLGIEGIWLSPINTCNCYHAYDVTDYYKINPSYEYDSYDYKYLLKECHKRGISVIMDLVINHTAKNHIWKTTHPSWYSNNDAFGGMSDLNYDNNEVKEEMKKVGQYWLKQGFDGFRLDAAMWLYNTKGNDASGVNHEKNYSYWNEWCDAMREVNPNCYIIGEVLNSNHDLSYQYAQAGFNSTFDFNVREHVYNGITNNSYDYVGKTITDMNKALKYNKNYILGRALSNHDIGRFSQVHSGMADADAYYFTDFNNLRLANALNIMMSGNTFIYYGDELGMSGTANGAKANYYNDLNFRTPMPWASSNGLTKSTKYFTDEVPGNKTTTTNTLSGKTAEEDAKNKSSLYSVMATLLNLKKNYNAIKSGTVKKLTKLTTGLKGYTLSDTKDTIAFVYNVSGSAKTYSYSGEVLYATSTIKNNSLELANKGFAVVKL